MLRCRQNNTFGAKKIVSCNILHHIATIENVNKSIASSYITKKKVIIFIVYKTSYKHKHHITILFQVLLLVILHDIRWCISLDT